MLALGPIIIYNLQLFCQKLKLARHRISEGDINLTSDESMLATPTRVHSM
jgi:hypothetical protein